MNDDSVMDDFYELGVADFLSGFVKSRRSEDHVIGLPIARFSACVYAWSMALVTLLAFAAFRVPMLINRAAVMIANLFLSLAV